MDEMTVSRMPDLRFITFKLSFIPKWYLSSWILTNDCLHSVSVPCFLCMLSLIHLCKKMYYLLYSHLDVSFVARYVIYRCILALVQSTFVITFYTYYDAKICNNCCQYSIVAIEYASFGANRVRNIYKIYSQLSTRKNNGNWFWTITFHAKLKQS